MVIVKNNVLLFTTYLLMYKVLDDQCTFLTYFKVTSSQLLVNYCTDNEMG